MGLFPGSAGELVHHRSPAWIFRTFQGKKIRYNRAKIASRAGVVFVLYVLHSLVCSFSTERSERTTHHEFGELSGTRAEWPRHSGGIVLQRFFTALKNIFPIPQSELSGNSGWAKNPPRSRVHCVFCRLPFFLRRRDTYAGGKPLYESTLWHHRA